MNMPFATPTVLLTVDAQGGTRVEQTGGAIVLVVHEGTKPAHAMMLPQTNDERAIRGAIQKGPLLHDHSERSIALAGCLRGGTDGVLQKAPPEATAKLKSMARAYSVPDGASREIFDSGDHILIPATGPGPIAILAADHADEITTAFNNFPDLVTSATNTAGALEDILRHAKKGLISQFEALEGIGVEVKNMRQALEMAGQL